MDNDFYFEESSPKKVKLICLVIVIAFIGVIILGIFIKNKYTLNIRKDLVFELGDTVSYDVSDYITNKVNDKDDYQLLLSSVSIEDDKFDEVGTYTFKIKYNNITKKGTLSVRDTTKPEVEVSDLTVGVNEDIDLSDFVTKCEDLSKPCNVTFKNEDDANLVSKAGTYSVDIVISDAQNNKVNKTVSLIVKKGYSSAKDKTADLTPASTDPELSDYNYQMIIKFDKGYTIEEIDDTSYYGDLMDITASDLHQYISSDYANNGITDVQIISVYNKYGYVIGYGIKVTLDNGLHFYITK